MSLEMLTIENYAEEVKAEILSKLDNVIVTIEKVNKNGTEYTGLSIRESNSKIGTIQYIDAAFSEGYSSENLANALINQYEMGEIPSEIKAEDFNNYDKIKNNLRVMLVNTERNKNSDRIMKPVSEVDDLSYMPYISLKGEKFNGLARVTNKMLHKWGITADEVINQAKSNTIDDEYICMNMFRFLCGLTGIPEEMAVNEPNISDPPMYVVTNKDMKYGTVNAILHGDKISKIFHGEDFYIIPSSMHEAICVPCYEITSMNRLEDLKNLILEVNATEIREEDFLSDNLFVYENGVFKTVA